MRRLLPAGFRWKWAAAWLLALGAAALALLVVAAVLWPGAVPRPLEPHEPAPSAVSLAVLGDSDNLGYQNRLVFKPRPQEAERRWQLHTFQWTEVLAQLRPRELELGGRVFWGFYGVIARIRELIGLPAARSPRKEDHLHNFSTIGGTCGSLVNGRFRQMPRLVALMGQAPERWRSGVVVISTGANDFNSRLDENAQEPAAPATLKIIDGCVQRMREAIGLLDAAYPNVRVLIVGLHDAANDPLTFGRFHSVAARANQTQALDRMNAALAALAAADPARIAFIDPRPWWAGLWGSRAADGEPAYKTLRIGSLAVTNSAGQSVDNAATEHHHPGLVWNTLWAQELVKRLNAAFDLKLTPISDDEAVRFIEAQAAAGAGRGTGGAP